MILDLEEIISKHYEVNQKHEGCVTQKQFCILD